MKILIIRLSSLGDIVLTTPVIESLVLAHKNIEIHYAVKENMASAIQNHPQIHCVHRLGKDWHHFITQLQQENFDYVLDLHNNIRSHRICYALGKPVSRFSKSNFSKWKMVWLKSKIEVSHVVVRYLETLKRIGIKPVFSPLSFFISPEEETEAAILIKQIPKPYISIALGATFATKKWLVEHFITLIQELALPVVLLGGKTEISEAKQIQEANPEVINLVGKTSLGASAVVVRESSWMLTHDTGLMHIGAALGTRMCVLWGNTVPEFGMYPWKSHFISIEKKLSCRPCSRLGYSRCPKGHFKCMADIKPIEVLQRLRAEKWISEVND